MTRWPALAALALGIALSTAFLVTPLRPWPDQGLMLEAALRHSRGLGLTTTSPTDDLARPRYSRLVYFPPAYPLLVSLLLKMGIRVDSAVKGINLVALTVGVLGWCALATRILETIPWRVMFAGLLVVAAGGTVPKGGTTDLILWAAMPFWALFLDGFAHGAHPTRFTLAAGVLVGVLIGVRWAAVFLVPAGLLFLILHLRLPTPRAALALASYVLPPVAMYGGLAAINRMLSGSASTLLSYTTPGWHVRSLLTAYPLEAVLATPIGLDAVLKRIGIALDPTAAVSPSAAITALVVTVPMVLAALMAWHVRHVERPAMIVLLACTLLALIAFLAWMTLRYAWSHVEWSYLDEGRYFRPVWPAALLMWLWGCSRLSKAARRGAWAILAVSFVYLLQAEVRWQRQFLTTPEESLELVRAVLERTSGNGRDVVFDIDISDYLLASEPGLTSYLYPEPAAAARLFTTEPMHVWIARRVRERTAYVKDPEFDSRRFEALRDHFRAARVWTSSLGGFELYHAIAAAPPETRPGP